jgi:predicted HAD superfamily Cof-like phosphohydrolase
MTDAIQSITQFNKLAGNTSTEFNARQIAMYTGLQFEELAEKINTIARGTCDGDIKNVLAGMAAVMHGWGMDFKKGFFDFEVATADPVAMLDDDVDQFVVTVGSLLSQGADIHGAINEVNRANMDKVWPDGTMHRDENGKIVKPAGWTEPDLAPFVCGA